MFLQPAKRMGKLDSLSSHELDLGGPRQPETPGAEILSNRMKPVIG
jgi:hypothetical protein